MLAALPLVQATFRSAVLHQNNPYMTVSDGSLVLGGAYEEEDEERRFEREAAAARLTYDTLLLQYAAVHLAVVKGRADILVLMVEGLGFNPCITLPPFTEEERIERLREADEREDALIKVKEHHARGEIKSEVAQQWVNKAFPPLGEAKPSYYETRVRALFSREVPVDSCKSKLMEKRDAIMDSESSNSEEESDNLEKILFGTIDTSEEGTTDSSEWTSDVERLSSVTDDDEDDDTAKSSEMSKKNCESKRRRTRVMWNGGLALASILYSELNTSLSRNNFPREVMRSRLDDILSVDFCCRQCPLHRAVTAFLQCCSPRSEERFGDAQSTSGSSSSCDHNSDAPRKESADELVKARIDVDGEGEARRRFGMVKLLLEKQWFARRSGVLFAPRLKANEPFVVPPATEKELFVLKNANMWEIRRKEYGCRCLTHGNKEESLGGGDTFDLLDTDIRPKEPCSARGELEILVVPSLLHTCFAFQELRPAASDSAPPSAAANDAKISESAPNERVSSHNLFQYLVAVEGFSPSARAVLTVDSGGNSSIKRIANLLFELGSDYCAGAKSSLERYEWFKLLVDGISLSSSNACAGEPKSDVMLYVDALFPRDATVAYCNVFDCSNGTIDGSLHLISFLACRFDSKFFNTKALHYLLKRVKTEDNGRHAVIRGVVPLRSRGSYDASPLREPCASLVCKRSLIGPRGLPTIRRVSFLDLVNMPAVGDKTPLMVALIHRNMDMAELLLEHGANPDYIGDSYWPSPSPPPLFQGLRSIPVHQTRTVTSHLCRHGNDAPTRQLLLRFGAHVGNGLDIALMHRAAAFARRQSERERESALCPCVCVYDGDEVSREESFEDSPTCPADTFYYPPVHVQRADDSFYAEYRLPLEAAAAAASQYKYAQSASHMNVRDGSGKGLAGTSGGQAANENMADEGRRIRVVAYTPLHLQGSSSLTSGLNLASRRSDCLDYGADPNALSAVYCACSPAHTCAGKERPEDLPEPPILGHFPLRRRETWAHRPMIHAPPAEADPSAPLRVLLAAGASGDLLLPMPYTVNDDNKTCRGNDSATTTAQERILTVLERAELTAGAGDEASVSLIRQASKRQREEVPMPM